MKHYFSQIQVSLQNWEVHNLEVKKKYQEMHRMQDFALFTAELLEAPRFQGVMGLWKIIPKGARIHEFLYWLGKGVFYRAFCGSSMLSNNANVITELIYMKIIAKCSKHKYLVMESA